MVDHYGGSIGADECLMMELLTQCDAGHPGDTPVILAITASNYTARLEDYTIYMGKLETQKASIKD